MRPTKKRPDNPENLDDNELLEAVKTDNEQREQALTERTQGRISPGPGHDMQKLLIYVRFLLIEYDLLLPAELEYEALRSEQLDKAEKFADEFEKAAEQAGRLLVPPAGPKIVKP